MIQNSCMGKPNKKNGWALYSYLKRKPKLHDIISYLYSDVPEEVLAVINSSVHISEFLWGNVNVFIHTGFTFQLHTGQKMELFYDTGSRKIIRQADNERFIGHEILGLLCMRKSDTEAYIESPFGFMYEMDQIDIDQEKDTNSSDLERFLTNYRGAVNFFESVFEFDSLKSSKKENENIVSTRPTLKLTLDNGEVMECNNFHFINYTDQTITEEFPFSKKCPFKVYFSNKVFSKYKDNQIEDDNAEDNGRGTDEKGTYEKYSGSYAQGVMDWSDEDIDALFDGDPDAYWNID